MCAETTNQPRRRALLWGLGAVAWGGLVASLGLGLGAALRLAGAGGGAAARPSLDLGPAAALEPGQVASQGDVALIRDQEGLYALSLVCPHLGCRPAWQQPQARFLCPCHGSAFALDGQRLFGPAPRGLRHLWVELDAGGRAWVDPNRPAEASRRLRLG